VPVEIMALAGKKIGYSEPSRQSCDGLQMNREIWAIRHGAERQLKCRERALPETHQHDSKPGHPR
jgi:hypothetical protein